MTTIDFSALTKMAEDAGFDTEDLEAGEYLAEVKNANFTTKSNGKSQFGFRFVVIGGPKQGKGVWKNLNVPTTESKPQAAHFFLRDLTTLGVDQQLAAANPEAAAQQIIGRQFNIKVSYRPKSGGGNWVDVAVSPAAQAAPAAPAQQQFPVQQPDAPAQPAWQSRPV